MRKTSRYSGALMKLGVLALGLLFSFATVAAAGQTGPSQPDPTAPSPTGAGLDSSLTLNVVDTAGNPVRGYRWLLEEDKTHYVVPDIIETDPLATQFHRSYVPVAAKGSQRDALSGIPINSSKRYFVSVLPDSGYNLSGAAILPGQTEVTVVLNALPFKTAQITVFIFEDTMPLNNGPDLPQEAGLAGFSVFLEDAGGRYGASAGAQVTDAYGNPVGTTYQTDINGNFILDADGVPIIDAQGLGFLVTDASGFASFKNLAPAKYGIFVVPPANMGWQQTTTIEGTKLIDAWVKSNEPPFVSEIGPVFPHIFMGFVQPMNNIPTPGGPTTDVTGQVVNLHLGAPPDFGFFEGGPFLYTTPWVAINDLALGAGQALYIAETVENVDGEPGAFTIPNLPPGSYELVVWDRNLDLIIDFKTLTVDPGAGTCNGGGSCDLGNIPVFAWFTALDNYVFYDTNEDGFPDPGEAMIPEQNVNIRWRDGTVYQAAPTDLEGYVPFDTVFPFFNWQVAEVDFARFKATGATMVVDAGGAITPGGVNVDGIDWTFDGQIEPLLQPDGKPYRTETGVVLTQAFQSMIGQRNVIYWGKKDYAAGENGGISGVVYYAVTRAEDDPAYAAVEPWEPGIPGVTVRLWDRTGRVLLNVTTTDDWDNSLPTGCLPSPTFILTVDGTPYPKDCFDGLANYNQMRDGIFDGGYAFETKWIPFFGAPGAVEVPLNADEYIVEVVPPENYEIASWEDRNVDFGLTVTPVPLLPPPCVGPERLVPDSFSLFPLFDENGNLESPTHAGEMMPLCSHKSITLVDGFNAAADFGLFTLVPPAAHIKGLVNDDTANQFGTNTPNIGEKFSPPWTPVAFRDFNGRELVRTYTDQFGNYNALVPSTFTTNLPAPSGMSPNMLITCINDPVMPDGTTDPAYDPTYGTLCYTWQFMPGVTTYLDTPIIPISANAGFPSNPVDCEYPDNTPMIASAVVNNGAGIAGPYVDGAGQSLVLTSMPAAMVPNPDYCPGLPLAFDCPTPLDSSPVVLRNYTFGPTPITVSFTRKSDGATTTAAAVGVTGLVADPIPLDPLALPGDGEYQVMVTTAAGVTTPTGITLHYHAGAPLAPGMVVAAAAPTGFPATPVQDAIDAAPADALVILPAGIYDEMVIMHKPLKLQGVGGSTVISAVNAPFDKLVNWRDTITDLVDNDSVDLLPGQQLLFTEAVGTLFAEEGAGIFVASRQSGAGSFAASSGALIDGLTVTGANIGGAITVNGFTPGLAISNVRVAANGGQYGGGIRFGHFDLTDGGLHTDANNDNAAILYSQIIRNGGLLGAGGGVSLYNGADNYNVSNNLICGNFTLGDGGGIGHLGLSDGGLIEGNDILFNQNFSQGATVSGGGIFVGGKGPAGATLTDGAGDVTISKNTVIGNLAGSGDGGGLRLAQVNGDDVEQNVGDPTAWHTIDVVNNIFANNIAGLAGGGVSLQDAVRVRMSHNTIANNDSTATASDAFAPGLPNTSTPQPAGLVARAHSTDFELLRIGDGAAGPVPGLADFSDPADFRNNILYQNRSFSFHFTTTAGPHSGAHLDPIATGAGDTFTPPPTSLFWDLAVLGSPSPLVACLGDSGNPFDSNVFTSLTNATTFPTPPLNICDYSAIGVGNVAGDPAFNQVLFNGDRRQSVATPLLPALMDVPPAFDEGGNFIQVVFGPLTMETTPARDYHLSGAAGAGDNNGTDLTGIAPFDVLTYEDIDSEARPAGLGADRGADEL